MRKRKPKYPNKKRREICDAFLEKRKQGEDADTISVWFRDTYDISMSTVYKYLREFRIFGGAKTFLQPHEKRDIAIEFHRLGEKEDWTKTERYKWLGEKYGIFYGTAAEIVRGYPTLTAKSKTSAELYRRPAVLTEIGRLRGVRLG